MGDVLRMEPRRRGATVSPICERFQFPCPLFEELYKISALKVGNFLGFGNWSGMNNGLNDPKTQGRKYEEKKLSAVAAHSAPTLT